MKIDCATKFRLYSTPDQESLLARTFGCVRFVWNAILDAREEAWKDFGVSASFPDASALLTDLKNDPDLAFLGEVSSVPPPADPPPPAESLRQFLLRPGREAPVQEKG